METMNESPKDLFIVDTDCGSDDAMAIVLALTKCSSQIIGFTCTFGNTNVDNVCRNVMKVMVVCNELNIPIYKGCNGPIIKRNYTPDLVHGADGLGECGEEFSTNDLVIDKEPASHALVRLAKKYPSKITVVALAPLTNLAIAHRIDPMFTKNLKSLVLMGGNYKGIGNTTETAEFNFYCDPEAAHIVVTEFQCPVIMVPWETTVEHGIEWEDFKTLMNKPNRKAHFIKRVSEIMAEFCRQTKTASLQDCDFLAMVAAMYPQASVKSSIKRAMVVECDGKYSTGLCICREPMSVSSSDAMIEIITEFDNSFLNKLREEMYE